MTDEGGRKWYKPDLDLEIERLVPAEGQSDFDLEMGLLNAFDEYNQNADYSPVPSLTSGGGKETYNSNSLARSLTERAGARNAPTGFFGQPGRDPGTEKRIPDRYFQQSSE